MSRINYRLRIGRMAGQYMLLCKCRILQWLGVRQMRIPGRDERGRESFCQGPKVVYILAKFMTGFCQRNIILLKTLGWALWCNHISTQWAHKQRLIPIMLLYRITDINNNQLFLIQLIPQWSCQLMLQNGNSVVLVKHKVNKLNRFILD